MAHYNSTFSGTQIDANLTLASTSAQIDGSGNLDVTGTVTANDLQVSAPTGNLNALLDCVSGGSTLQFRTGSGANSTYINSGTGGSANLRFRTGGAIDRQKIDANGDISFMEDTGTTPKFFWDASAESLGIGTSSPSGLLQIYESGTSAYKTYTATGTGAILQSYQSQGSPYTKTTDLVAGSDGTVPSEIRMHTRTAGSSSVDERMRIDSTGSVMVGTTASIGTSAAKLEILGGSGGGRPINTKVTVNTSANHISFNNGNGQVGYISTNGSATTYATSSDYRLKEDLQPMVGSIDRVKALKPWNFAWKANGSRVDGFMAHEAQEVVAECATGSKDAMRDETDSDGNITSVPDYQGIDQSKLVPLLVSAIQELTARLETLEG